MELYNLLEIELELREIADTICKNGLNRFLEIKGISVDDFIKEREKHNKDFIVSCHTEFKKAQDRIITNVLLIKRMKNDNKKQNASG